ncbi:ABC transporter permease [Olivibacter sp. SA151]|uniref:ABC transporter permease n=1 Tax=Olivibacter jilunii TaxID=985016 RepID=UPI003F139CAD
MLKNYFKTAWRNLWKNKFYSLLNILGLAIGMAVCIVIILFVNYERNFDAIHKKNIYRLNEVQKWEGMISPQKVALSMYPMGPSLQQEFAEIVNFTRINQFGKVSFQLNGNRHAFPSTFLVDSTFLQLFDFKLLKGNRSTALQKPNSLVLTEKTAINIFGKEDALGKTVTTYGRDTTSFTVTGVLTDIPENSHIQFDALFSMNTYVGPQQMQNWGSNWLTTYLEIAPNVSMKNLEKRFPAFLKKRMGEEQAKGYELFLQKLRDVHAESTDITHDYINYQKFNSKYTIIFFVIAIAVLVIASINFVNLTTARSAGRAKEIGVRKSTGAKRGQLYLQFIGESIFLCFIALALACGMVKLMLLYVNHISLRSIDFPIFSSLNLLFLLLIGAIFLGFMAGLYPAAYLSAFKPTVVLKGTVNNGRNKTFFRNVLVVGQFTCAIVLMTATLLAIKQLRFMQKKDVGFTREQIVTVTLDNYANRKYETLKQELLANSLIKGVAANQQKLGNNLHQTGVKFYGNGAVKELATSQIVVDPDFLTVYQIPLLAGRNFSKDRPNENGKTYIINETLAKELLKESPNEPISSLIGKRFGFNGLDSASTIIGIAKDFNFNSLHHKIETLCLFNQKDFGYNELSIKIDTERATDALAYIQSVWKRISPDSDFEYQFLDDHFAELYKTDQTTSEIVGILALLAVLISCMGLLGLATFVAEQRVKEIGIRKVLGASVQGLVQLLSKDFLKLVLIAICIAVPIAWLGMNKWLEDFAYRVNIEWWIFALVGLLAISIAMLTIGFRAIKSARANPVKSLRTE